MFGPKNALDSDKIPFTKSGAFFKWGSYFCSWFWLWFVLIMAYLSIVPSNDFNIFSLKWEDSIGFFFFLFLFLGNFLYAREWAEKKKAILFPLYNLLAIILIFYMVIHAVFDLQWGHGTDFGGLISGICMTLPILYFVIPGMIRYWKESELRYHSADNDFDWKWFLRNTKPVSIRTSTYYRFLAISVGFCYLLFGIISYNSEETTPLLVVIVAPWYVLCSYCFLWMIILYVLRLLGVCEKYEVYLQTDPHISEE
jgi:hypothetical protein